MPDKRPDHSYGNDREAADVQDTELSPRDVHADDEIITGVERLIDEA
jgi:hypothetical protein